MMYLCHTLIERYSEDPFINIEDQDQFVHVHPFYYGI